MPKFLNSIDSTKNQLLNVRLQNLAAAPSAPVAGQIYFDTVLVHSYIYTGAGWEQASGPPGSDGHLTFGVTGTPVLNSTTNPVYLDRAVTCDGLTIACVNAPSGGPSTLTIQTSTDGTTWADLGTISLAAGALLGTAALTSSIAANTVMRGKFTAVNAVSNMNVILFYKG